MVLVVVTGKEDVEGVVESLGVVVFVVLVMIDELDGERMDVEGFSGKGAGCGTGTGAGEGAGEGSGGSGAGDG